MDLTKLKIGDSTILGSKRGKKRSSYGKWKVPDANLDKFDLKKEFLSFVNHVYKGVDTELSEKILHDIEQVEYRIEDLKESLESASNDFDNAYKKATEFVSLYKKRGPDRSKYTDEELQEWLSNSEDLAISMEEIDYVSQKAPI